MSVLDEFRWRGLLQDATEGADEHFQAGPVTAYIGFDPTASSLHVGSLLPILGLVHLQRHGHHPLALVGGGTGLIGDPSGKVAERSLLNRDEAEANAQGIRDQLAHFLDFDSSGNPARLINNLEWLGEAGLLHFLRDVGKHFSVNAMLRRESVRRRVESDEAGISFTEFSYTLLQAYDFLELHQRMGCTAQLGGSDQWGNITAGIDLIRRVNGSRAFGAVFPLVTTASGTKFGKTEEGTIWLDPERTSPYRFYQFWLNTTDADAGRYLRYFTFLSREEVETLEQESAERPQDRAAQQALADDVTRRVHGAEGLERARRASSVLFGGLVEGLSAGEVQDIFADVPSAEMPRGSLDGEGMPVVEFLFASGSFSSKGEARRALQGGGVYLNNRRLEDPAGSVSSEAAVDGRYLIVRRGKKNYHLVHLVG
ncbi:MAG: tyrosine--tRNA ligase [Gemmatimonadota bacterium]